MVQSEVSSVDATRALGTWSKTECTFTAANQSQDTARENQRSETINEFASKEVNYTRPVAKGQMFFTTSGKRSDVYCKIISDSPTKYYFSMQGV